MRRILTLTAALLMVLTLSACQLYNRDYKEEVLEYAMIVHDGSKLTVLDQYPNLEYVDLRGSTCYEDILDYSASHPDVKVRFSITLGQQFFNQDVTEVALLGQNAEYEALLNNLKYFRFLKSVHIDQIQLTKAQLEELSAAYPQIAFTYTVKLGDVVCDNSVTKLDLSNLDQREIPQAVASLELLPNLTNVDLSDSTGNTRLTVVNAGDFIKAYPNITFNYQFKLFGETLSTATEKLVYKDVQIGNNGLDQIRNAIGAMPNCTYICMDNCNIDNETMEQFRKEYPEINIVWRIFVDQYSVLTDTEVVLMRSCTANSDVDALKYCPNVKYLDLAGSNNRDFSFLSSMANLECAVLQDTFISDLSVLQNSKNLTWLSLAACTSVKDVAPLSEFSNLKNLNLSATKVKELTPLKNVPLERFKCTKTAITATEFNEFKSAHPNCLTTTTGNIVGKGWRYDDVDQKEPCAYYQHMMEVFGYSR